MTLKEKFVAFNRIAPVQTATVQGKPFAYRYYKNPYEKKDNLMTEPTVIWDLKGGHLAMMASMDEYIDTLSKFIRERNENYQTA